MFLWWDFFFIVSVAEQTSSVKQNTFNGSSIKCQQQFMIQCVFPEHPQKVLAVLCVFFIYFFCCFTDLGSPGEAIGDDTAGGVAWVRCTNENHCMNTQGIGSRTQKHSWKRQNINRSHSILTSFFTITLISPQFAHWLRKIETGQNWWHAQSWQLAGLLNPTAFHLQNNNIVLDMKKKYS